MSSLREQGLDSFKVNIGPGYFSVLYPKKNLNHKTAYLIGTGPSLRKIDMKKLKDKRTITFNRAYVAFEDWGFEPSYYLSIDSEDIKSTSSDINSLIKNSNIERFFLPHSIQTSSDFSGEKFVEADNVQFLIDPPQAWSILLPISHNLEIKDTNLLISPMQPNAGFMGLKMLYMMGYEEVALLGCDARYTIDKDTQRSIEWTEDGCISHEDYDPNHFRDDYFGNGQTFGRPNEQQQVYIWDCAATEINDYKLPMKVYSCSEGSNLNKFFPYIDFDEFLNGKR
jgi:hypothetical protein